MMIHLKSYKLFLMKETLLFKCYDTYINISLLCCKQGLLKNMVNIRLKVVITDKL